ncbi:MAG: serine hydrolase [Planctomycetes bacterium]|nr:serine hydrolase [Planctomycetota bacterium]
MRLRHRTAIAALTAALLAPAAAAQVSAYHDVDGNGHQAQWNLLSGLGYRPIALSIYGTAANPQYAAVWVVRPGPVTVGFHGYTAAEYQTFAATSWAQGYRPKLLTALGTAGNPRFAGTFELTHADGWASHGLTQQEFWDQRNAAQDQGLDVTTVDVYGDANDPRYIVAFGPVAAGQTEVVSTGDDGFQEHFDALVAGHARPAMVAFNDAHRYVSLWHSNDVGDWVAHANMTSAQYQNYCDQYILQGRYPITVHGSGSGAARRFAAVWASSDLPLPPTFTATGPVVPQFAPFDTWAQNWMSANETRAAALAIVRNGRLVYARGYTRARPGYPTTLPTSLFEVASCSKPITSIAMHQHFANPLMAMAPDDDMLGYFPGSTAFDSRLDDITLHELLTHQGGWNRDVSPDPMVGLDPTIGSALQQPLPIGKGQIRQYMFQTQPLDFTPGNDSEYSNFGFSVLGQVLERRNPGLSYEQIVQRDILQPLGLWRPRMARSTKAGLWPGEVFYHPFVPMLSRSVLSDDRPWVAGQYGAWNKENMDSHGGWVMSAPDFAKILAAFDLGASNPLLDPDQTGAMWTVEPGYNSLMRGWFRAMVADGLGGQVEMYHHNGRLAGATSFIARRADGLSFVFLTNGDRRNLFGNVHGAELSNIANTISLWPNHDLFPNFSIPPFQHQSGTLTAFGQSCYGPVGFPTFAVGGTIEVGGAIDFTVGNVLPGRLVVTALGLQQLAVPLAGLGAPNCWLFTDPIVMLHAVSAGGGTTGAATMPWQAPAGADAVGLAVIAQGAVFEPQANPFGLVTTHAWQLVLGGWQ